jgi:hypothetical protein
VAVRPRRVHLGGARIVQLASADDRQRAVVGAWKSADRRRRRRHYPLLSDRVGRGNAMTVVVLYLSNT